MANMKGAANFRNPACGKQYLLPPKSPFPSIPPPYGDYGSIGSKDVLRSREGHRHHQRTSSESFLIEEQPSWLDELLDEPETPVRRGAHRRSSSDSFAYLDGATMYSNLDRVAQDECRQRTIPIPSWGSQEFDLKDVQPYYPEASSFAKPHVKGWDSGLNMVSYPCSSLPAMKDKGLHPGSLCALREADGLASNVAVKQEQEESTQDLKGISERREGSHAKHSQSETDTKRVKQQFAQRSRVRKLQYIAELERNVQALQAEGLEVSAELEFVDQQNLILNLENKALKQRLESLEQEHLIKRFHQEMLEREIARLRLMFQQQQPLPPQPSPIPTRSGSRDLNAQFANLSLKHKEANSGRDPVTGPLRI